MSKVINFADAKKRHEAQKLEAEEFIEISTLPPEVEQKLNVENEKVLKMVEFLNDQLDQYGTTLDQEEHQSVLVPIEALARLGTGLLVNLDAHINPSIVQQQQEIRSILGEMVAGFMHDACADYAMNEKKPIFQHDMYLALFSAMFSLIFEQRMSSILNETAQVTKGEESNEEHPAQNVDKKPEQ